MGPPNRDIIAMARPGLRADLRAALHSARDTGRRTVRDRIAVQTNGGTQMVSIAVEPVSEGSEKAFGIVFFDRGAIRTDDETTGAASPEGEDPPSASSSRSCGNQGAAAVDNRGAGNGERRISLLKRRAALGQ